MSELIQQLNEIINKSDLADMDKEDFSIFLEDISDEDASQLIQTFTANPEKIAPFWAILKEKLLFLQILAQSEDFSDEAKKDIGDKVSQMSDEEFDAFIGAIRDVHNGANPEEKINQLAKESEQNHKEFLELAQKFLAKTQEYQKELEQELQQ